MFQPVFWSFRDLGERLRTLVAQEFPQGPISKVNEGKLNRDWESLNRIANNEYRDRFPRKFAGSTVFDWDLEALKLATSNEGLDTINNEYKKRLEEYFVGFFVKYRIFIDAFWIRFNSVAANT